LEHDNKGGQGTYDAKVTHRRFAEYGFLCA
jgi:hypothetical protein